LNFVEQRRLTPVTTALSIPHPTERTPVSRNDGFRAAHVLDPELAATNGKDIVIRLDDRNGKRLAIARHAEE